MGIIKINRPEENWWERIYLLEIARGLGITIRHAFLSLFTKDHITTYQYPEEQRPIPERSRGLHKLRRRKDGTPVCVACYCCQTACTPNAIDIVAEESDDPAVEKRPKEFRINMLRCIFCGMCVEACPKDAIYMTKEFELADNTREKLQYNLEDLLEDKSSYNNGEKR
jgi:NADH-quinone oxidoreductase subunit I